MFYAVIIVCSAIYGQCIGLDDESSPYVSERACAEGAAKREEQVIKDLTPKLGPIGTKVDCDTLANLRKRYGGKPFAGVKES